MQLIKAPETNYSSFDDIGKYNMIWNVSIILIPVFIFLLAIHVYFNDDNIATTSAGLLVAILNVLILIKSKKYLVVGIFSVVLGTLIVQVSIFIVDDSHLISDTMWCVLVGFFSFFLFGFQVGLVVLLLNLTGLLIFLMNGSTTDILNKGISIHQVDSRMVINVYYVALTMAFVIYKMSQNNKEINERYAKEIRRNEILIKEIHHRVKNNLQIISSLLRLQAAESTDEKVEEHFNEAISRIRSMALIHEKMYHEDDLSSINVSSYLNTLVNDIVDSIKPSCHIQINTVSEISEIDIENIVPVSLIFNELVMNSLKHGFANKNDGQIKIEITKEGGEIVFHYHDDGVWKEPTSKGTFGSELIDILTQQLDGTVKRVIDNGTHYYFIFKSKLFLA